MSLGSILRPGAYLTNLQQSGNRAQFIPSSLAATNSLRTLSSLGSDGSTFWLSFLISFDGTLAQNTADVRIDGKNGNLSVGRELVDQTNWSVEDSASANPYTQSSIAIIPGQALFAAIRIDQNADPNANESSYCCPPSRINGPRVCSRLQEQLNPCVSQPSLVLLQGPTTLLDQQQIELGRVHAPNNVCRLRVGKV
jgi:hypothetical protein